MAIKEARRSPKPPKLAAPAVNTRPLHRLSAADRARIEANVADFIAYAKKRRARKMRRELTHVYAEQEFSEENP